MVTSTVAVAQNFIYDDLNIGQPQPRIVAGARQQAGAQTCHAGVNPLESKNRYCPKPLLLTFSKSQGYTK